jgi:hypothetical protein
MRENKQMLAAKMDQQGRTHHVTQMLYPYSFFGIIKEFKVCLKTYKECILRPVFLYLLLENPVFLQKISHNLLLTLCW